MSFNTLSNPLSSNNESDFFKRKFAAFNSLERQLKDWQAINFKQLKIRTSKPAKLNKDISNGEEVSLQKYEKIRYECVHYGIPSPYKWIFIHKYLFFPNLFFRETWNKYQKFSFADA